MGKIIISNTCHKETALIHELLHLHLPLKYNVYTLCFPKFSAELAEFSNLLENMIDHDVMIGDFLSSRYDIKYFLTNPYLNIDYELEKKTDNDVGYWMFEYLRHIIGKKHLPEQLEIENCKLLHIAREFALKKYLTISENLKLSQS